MLENLGIVIGILASLGVFTLIGKFFHKMYKSLKILDNHTTMLTALDKGVKLVGAKVEAVAMATEKQIGNGYSTYYREAYKIKLKELELEE